MSGVAESGSALLFWENKAKAVLIHEYQAKEILKQLGIPVPEGKLAGSAAEARQITLNLSPPVILKAQVLSGGRGKAGGILKAKSPEEAEFLAQSLLGQKLATAQSGNQSLLVRNILIEKAVNLKKEFYLSLAVDRLNETLMVIVSQQGGIEIEESARSRPELIKKIIFSPEEGLRSYQARQLAYFLDLEETGVKEFVFYLKQLGHFFVENDLKLLEINPLALTEDNRLIAIDARMDFDDYGLVRHPDIASLYDYHSESEQEREARKFKMNYLKMSGNIGCLVNGAGLAMATMDIIQYFGGQPANFLDIGGGVTEEAVSKAFEILISDEQVTAALVNIFGGIVRCDLVARGVVNAARRISRQKPVVVRLEGTNVAEGKKILEQSGLPFYFASGFEPAAKLAVSLAGKVK